LNTACAPSGAAASCLRSRAESRRIFRSCFARYLECIERPGSRPGKNEEYIADFERVGERALTCSIDRQIFRLHVISGADFGTCLRRTGLTLRVFQRAVTAIEEQLGAAFADTRPYPLFPVAGYFTEVRR
jgi:hypothetical protein